MQDTPNSLSNTYRLDDCNMFDQGGFEILATALMNADNKVLELQ